MPGLDTERKQQRLEMMVNFAASRSDRLHLQEICEDGVNTIRVVNEHEYFKDELPDVWLA